MSKEGKKIITAKSFVCPFCGNEQDVKVSEKIVYSDKSEAGTSVSYWTCSVCGSDNDIFPEGYIEEFDNYRKFIKQEDWNGLINFCKNKNKKDYGFPVFELCKWYAQKHELKKALDIANILLELNSNDVQAREMKNKLDDVIKVKKIQKKVNIDMDEIMYALQDHGWDHENYLNTKTGEVVFVSEFDEEWDKKLKKDMRENPDKYVHIEPIPSRKSYNFMVRFSGMVDEELEEKLQIALNGKGAFRRFKDVLLNYPEERQMWFDFRNRIVFKWALDWIIRNFEDVLENGK